MKKEKMASNFQQLDALQMRKIDGGVWVEETNPDGTTTTVWVE